ncbi:hypothetical protein FKM82_029142 [Ascaphus truei]
MQGCSTPPAPHVYTCTPRLYLHPTFIPAPHVYTWFFLYFKARIKKIMQTDEEIGKVAAAVPVIISRALELFLESLLTKACQVTQSRSAKTMTTSHL